MFRNRQKMRKMQLPLSRLRSLCFAIAAEAQPEVLFCRPDIWAKLQLLLQNQ